jgi:flagellar hook-associated protein 1 FlgK
MYVQADDLPALRQRLDGLASGVAASINQQQLLGTDQDGKVGQPLFVDSAGVTGNIDAGNIGLSSALKDQPRRLAAAGNPVTVQPHVLQQGDLSITGVSGTATPAITARTNLVFTDASGAYEWRNASGATLSSGSWTAGTPISYGGLSITLAGQPQAGEGLSLGPGTENGNALLMAQLGDAPMADGTLIKDGYARLISDVGSRSQGAQGAASVSAEVTDQARSQLGSQTGVNLDEEAAKLIQYQQSYQAAAKVLQVAQRIFDTLLSTTGS